MSGRATLSSMSEAASGIAEVNAVRINRAYWVFSAVFCCLMLLSAAGNLLRAQAVADDFRRLGYPDYLLTVLGVAKVLGVAALLCPGVPHLKEWAYAGFSFALLGATISQLMSASTVAQVVPALVCLFLLAGSYLSYRIRVSSV